MALILNIESSNSTCSVCIADKGEVKYIKETTESNKHSEMLASYIQQILEEAKITASQLDAVAVSIGPGSYTGLRIGVSLAKGIAYSANIPVIAVSTLKSLAWAAQSKIEETAEYTICPMIDARRMEVYSQAFDHALSTKSDAEAVIVDENSYADLLQHKTFFCGNGSEKCKTALHNPNAVFLEIDTSSSFIAMLAEEQFNNNDFVDTAYFEPFYLKQFSTTVSKKKLL